ncbi:MAG: hypothetical protein JWO35_58 [Candidatus Saccharibacteria bacterium]|nr:hypothetical protein [Candidatus Saccharibacteria bacterium]
MELKRAKEFAHARAYVRRAMGKQAVQETGSEKIEPAVRFSNAWQRVENLFAAYGEPSSSSQSRTTTASTSEKIDDTPLSVAITLIDKPLVAAGPNFHSRSLEVQWYHDGLLGEPQTISHSETESNTSDDDMLARLTLIEQSIASAETILVETPQVALLPLPKVA